MKPGINIPDSIRNYIPMIKLVALLLFAPAAIYVLSVSGTAELFREYRRTKESADRIPQTVGRCEEFSASHPLLSNGMLMQVMAGVCSDNKVYVGLFLPEEIRHEGNLHLVSAQLTLTGEFVALLKVLAHIESVPDMKISSGKFKTVKTGKNGRTVQMDLKVLQVEDATL